MKKDAKETVKETKTKKKTITEKELIKKEDKKVVVKKDDKKNKTKKKTNKKEKQNIFKRLWNFFGDVKKEMKKVHFPNKKEMIKYSLATLEFIVFFALFFYLIEIIFAFIRSLV